MRVDKYTMAQSWMRQDDATPEEAKATWDTLETEFEDKRKAQLMASAETDEIIKTINDKFGPGTVFPASEAPIPPKTLDRDMWESANERLGFYEGKLVTQGKRKGQWAIYNVPASVEPKRTKFFPDETTMNEWIANQPGKGRKDFGKHVTGAIHKGKVSEANQNKLEKLKEIIIDSNNQYKKNITSSDALTKAGWKDGWQAISSKGNLRKLIGEELSKLTSNVEKIENYVNNVMFAEDALVKDFKNPISHIQKKFGVSEKVTKKWKQQSQAYANNKALFSGLARELSFNKYANYADGTPRLMGDYVDISYNKMPSSTGWFSGDEATKFIGDTAKRNYLQMKAAGLEPKVTFITDPAITAARDWQFIDNETGRLFSMDPSIDTVEFQGKTYKNNYLQHKDARKLYKKEFGNLYKIYDDNLAKYLDADSTIIGKNGKPIKLDTILKQQAFEKSKTSKNPEGKKDFLRRRFMEVDHADLWDDPFGRKKDGLRLIDRSANQQAGLYKRLDKYKNNPDLLNQKLDEIGYNKKFNNTDELIKFYSDKATGRTFSQTIRPRGSEAGFISGELLEDTAKGFKKVGSVARKLGAEFEAAFIGADFLNNLDNGMDTDTAFQTALENATLGLYKGGQRAQWEDFKNAGKELGHNPENLSEVKGIIDLGKMLKKEKENLKNLKNYLESGDPTLIDDNLADLQKRIEAQELLVPKLEKEFNDSLSTFKSKDNAQDIISNYQDTVGYVGRKEYNKNVDDALLDKGRKHRVNPEMSSIGSPLWESVSDLRTYLPQNLMETSDVLRPVVRGLRKLPGVFGDIWDPTSEQAKLSAMSAEEIEQRAKDLNIQKQNYHPVTGNTMTEQQMEPYYKRYYSNGGIATLKIDDELRKAQEEMKRLMKQYKNKDLDWDAVKRSYRIWTK